MKIWFFFSCLSPRGSQRCIGRRSCCSLVGALECSGGTCRCDGFGSWGHAQGVRCCLVLGHVQAAGWRRVHVAALGGCGSELDRNAAAASCRRSVRRSVPVLVKVACAWNSSGVAGRKPGY